MYVMLIGAGFYSNRCPGSKGKEEPFPFLTREQLTAFAGGELEGLGNQIDGAAILLHKKFGRGVLQYRLTPLAAKEVIDILADGHHPQVALSSPPHQPGKEAPSLGKLEQTPGLIYQQQAGTG